MKFSKILFFKELNDFFIKSRSKTVKIKIFQKFQNLIDIPSDKKLVLMPENLTEDKISAGRKRSGISNPEVS